jgi:hypothetical protein
VASDEHVDSAPCCKLRATLCCRYVSSDAQLLRSTSQPGPADPSGRAGRGPGIGMQKAMNSARFDMDVVVDEQPQSARRGSGGSWVAGGAGAFAGSQRRFVGASGALHGMWCAVVCRPHARHSGAGPAAHSASQRSPAFRGVVLGYCVVTYFVAHCAALLQVPRSTGCTLRGGRQAVVFCAVKVTLLHARVKRWHTLLLAKHIQE